MPPKDIGPLMLSSSQAALIVTLLSGIAPSLRAQTPQVVFSLHERERVTYIDGKPVRADTTTALAIRVYCDSIVATGTWDGSDTGYRLRPHTRIAADTVSIDLVPYLPNPSGLRGRAVTPWVWRLTVAPLPRTARVIALSLADGPTGNIAIVRPWRSSYDTCDAGS